jgi:hypothetical protein
MSISIRTYVNGSGSTRLHLAMNYRQWLRAEIARCPDHGRERNCRGADRHLVFGLCARQHAVGHHQPAQQHGIDIKLGTPADAAATVATDCPRWIVSAKLAGIKAE